MQNEREKLTSQSERSQSQSAPHSAARKVFAPSSRTQKGLCFSTPCALFTFTSPPSSVSSPICTLFTPLASQTAWKLTRIFQYSRAVMFIAGCLLSFDVRLGACRLLLVRFLSAKHCFFFVFSLLLACFQFSCPMGKLFGAFFPLVRFV